MARHSRISDTVIRGPPVFEFVTSKNRPAAAQDKFRESKDSKKDKTQGPPKAEITVVLTEKQADKYLKNAKVITAQDLASKTGVKISAANKYLREAVRNGTARKVGGYSGHWLYQGASS